MKIEIDRRQMCDLLKAVTFAEYATEQENEDSDKTLKWHELHTYLIEELQKWDEHVKQLEINRAENKRIRDSLKYK